MILQAALAGAFGVGEPPGCHGRGLSATCFQPVLPGSGTTLAPIHTYKQKA